MDTSQDPSSSPLTALPTDVRGGAHINLLEHVSGDTVTFVLHVPYKPYVSVVGDFNQWNTRSHPMVTDGRGTWWITLEHPGATRYGFYVAIDDQSHVWVGDPYATQLRWRPGEPWAWLAEPNGDFPWTDQAWRTPAMRDLVIYELCVRDFAGRWQASKPEYGTFRRMLDKLDYLSDLGINSVELMPIQAFPGDSSWGYNPVFYCAPAQAYGSPEELKALVDACHARGMAVILDIALNHAWGEHPYYNTYPPMFGPQGEWLPDWNPYFHHTPAAINGWGGVDWDHFVPETTRYAQDVVRYWLTEYHVDGFRFDWVCGVDYDSQDPMRPGFHPYHGIAAVAWAARQIKPDCLLIGEYWQLPGTHPEKTGAKMVAETDVGAVWNGLFHHTLDDVINQRWQWEQRDIFRAIGGFREEGFLWADAVINYSCSHDEVRPEHEIKYYSSGNIQRPRGMSLQALALRKGLLGLVTLFGAPGVPMIYAGQEYGDDAPRTIDFCPLNWQRLDRPEYRRHLETVKRLIAARRRYAALRSDSIQFEENDFAAEGIVRFVRRDEAGNQVWVVLNFSGDFRTTSLPLTAEQSWCDVITERTVVAQHSDTEMVLEPWQGMMVVPECPMEKLV